MVVDLLQVENTPSLVYGPNRGSARRDDNSEQRFEAHSLVVIAEYSPRVDVTNDDNVHVRLQEKHT